MNRPNCKSLFIFLHNVIYLVWFFVVDSYILCFLVTLFLYSHSVIYLVGFFVVDSYIFSFISDFVFMP